MKFNCNWAIAASLFLYANNASAQDRFAYAITDQQKEGINWTCLRQIDLSTGKYGDLILQGNNITQPIFDAASRQKLAQPINDSRMGALPNAPFVTGVAAIAYDRKYQRLFFTPMFFDQLRYIDLRSNQVYLVQQELPEALRIKSADQGNIITRMAIASDGYGYALTNDAQQFIRFSTGKIVQVESLGGLVDDPANKEISVHNACTSYGGDMIADNSGYLYLFTARNHVFRIDPQSRVALHLGSISGLPEGFSINGAAVTDNNQVLVSSAMTSKNLYLVDADNWTATETRLEAWRSSDMANSNLLSTRPAPAATNIAVQSDEKANGNVKIFPNPAKDHRLQMNFQLSPGNYSIQVLDISGKAVALSVVNLQGKGQMHSIQLPSSAKAGTYLVKVLDGRNNTVFGDKFVLQ